MTDGTVERPWKWWINERGSFCCEHAAVFTCRDGPGYKWYIAAIAKLPDGHTFPVISRYPYDNAADAIIAIARAIGDDGYARLGQGYWYGDICCGAAVSSNGLDEAFG